MIVSSRHETPTTIQFKLPWDKNTARGFVLSVVIIALFLLFMPLFKIQKSDPHEIHINSVPIEILNFGLGDGTGMSKGNLTAEGAMNKGAQPKSELEDASKAALTKQQKNTVTGELSDATKITPVNQLPSDQKSNTKDQGSSSRNVGSPNGSADGTGLGDKGSGAGKGLGFGDIEWGGGGNRVVLQKKLPKFPQGVNTSAQIRIKFIVQQDGTVSSMVPLQKGDPTLEKAAMDALKQWRFNKLEKNIEMVGIITFTFKLS
ncbi:MAG: hypothetical protein QG635_624 [Bacteroidota bacterium]|nr:hypothetical protein [Bacteroidota bacterium]